jgi:8-oxo-dGTP diphosphatase
MSTFNIRVYGICIYKNEYIILSDEKVGDFYFTKFPGGGLEFGEGTIDCLKREFQEEFGLNIEIQKHFYTTDFFQVSKFRPDDQIISIYYLININTSLNIPISETPLALPNIERAEERIRLVPLKVFSQSQLQLPIDKHVAQLLIDAYLD